MGKPRILAFSIFLFISSGIFAQPVRISLFNDLSIHTVVVSISIGYRLECDGHPLISETTGNDAFYLTIISDKIIVRNKEQALGIFSEIKLIPINANAYFNLIPIVPKANMRQYSGALNITIAYNRISLINEVDPNHYISGVVEAEAGTNATIEFYKAQAVLVRTYLYGHRNKHESENFNLCDGVHCQAYKGLATKNRLINEATIATTGIVALYNDSTFITAAFHANCGGYTESSQNAWLSNKEYLIPVKDPFCQNSPAARWQKTITVDQWRQYLKAHGFKSTGRLPYIDFSIVNTERVQYYCLKHDSIPYKQIRSDFQLKSSFFSISATINELTFNGRGYGHGVGLCQEGAIQMSKVGYKYEDILQYYFKGIRLEKR